jgi:hypothetical protein
MNQNESCKSENPINNDSKNHYIHPFALNSKYLLMVSVDKSCGAVKTD